MPRTTNEYVNELEEMGLYAQCPKTVFAAIAYSLARRLYQDQGYHPVDVILAEWEQLYLALIVEQRPPASL